MRLFAQARACRRRVKRTCACTSRTSTSACMPSSNRSTSSFSPASSDRSARTRRTTAICTSTTTSTRGRSIISVRISRPTSRASSRKTHENKSDVEKLRPDRERSSDWSTSCRPSSSCPVLGEQLDLHAFMRYVGGAELRRAERRIPRLRRDEQLLLLPARELVSGTCSSPGTRTTRSRAVTFR